MSDDLHPACAGSDVHFPDLQDRTILGRETAAVQTEYALQLCSECPLEVECLRYSIDREIPWGIFGGVDENTRRDMIDANRAARDLPPLWVPGVSRGPAPPDPVEVARAAETADEDDEPGEWADAA